jgi:uracil-DNA glycosylase
MVIGEGPGKDEDETGEPFVGRAGRLLTDILKAINFEREEVYIANVVKCRPPGNRTPMLSEMKECIPYLERQIEIIKPKLILCLGLTAAQSLLDKRDSLGNFRNSDYSFKGAKVVVTYHPAALLRNPHWKKDCWADVQKFRKLYDDMKLKK